MSLLSKTPPSWSRNGHTCDFLFQGGSVIFVLLGSKLLHIAVSFIFLATIPIGITSAM